MVWGFLLPGINLVGFLERVCFEFQGKKNDFKDGMSVSPDALKYLSCFYAV